MDETLIIFQSLVSGSYMNTRRMSPEKQALGKKLGMQMMKLILWPLDNAMFFEEIEQVQLCKATTVFARLVSLLGWRTSKLTFKWKICKSAQAELNR